MIYLDHAASTFPYVEVIRLFNEAFANNYANPSAAHRLGMNEELRIKEAKRTLADLLSCEVSELTFTSGATESANAAIKGYLLANRHSGTQVLVSAGEHPAVRITAKHICEKLGLELKIIPLTRAGVVDLDALEGMLNPHVALVCVMAINNETGAINDLSKIARLIKQRAAQAKLCVDYVQALAKQTITLRQSAVDLGIFSGHKIHAPKGVGLLYVKKGVRIEPLLHGGGHQLGMRAGTENSQMAEAFTLATRLGIEHMQENTSNVMQLRQTFLDALEPSTYVDNSANTCSPWILNVSFPGVRGETLLHALADKEVYISQASSCHSKAPYSDVLQAMQLPVELMQSAVRISFDASQSNDEIKEAARLMNETVKLLKR